MDIDKLILKFKRQKTQDSYYNLKKNKGGGLTLPNFKVLYAVTVINSVWYWTKDINRQNNGIESKNSPTNVWSSNF